MATYIPNTDREREQMLSRMGLSGISELFTDIPKEKRYPQLELPSGKTEIEIEDYLQSILSDKSNEKYLSFMGAGSYNHFVPAIVDYLSSRGEFATAYTPYQPEASQGTLQAIFEYQSMVSELIGSDIVNASHYDGATALAEAILMSIHISRSKRKKVLLSGSIHPEYIEVIKTYTKFLDIDMKGNDEPDMDVHTLAEQADNKTACLVVQYPDFFGKLQDLKGLAQKVHEKGSLLVVHVDPIMCGLFKNPGAFDADIITGEGQSLGNYINFGGPYLGIFGCKESLVRKMPGRIAGQTQDRNGKSGYVLTLNTREQHIRREKATSNICTNQGLMALRAAIYLTAVGKSGIRKIGELCYQKAHYAATKINSIPGCTVDFSRPFFKEFVVDLPYSADTLFNKLLNQNIRPGVPLGRFFSNMKNKLLICVTEVNTKNQIDQLVHAIQGEIT